ncbi:hypothetical protein B5M09_013786 [Aphanomyces astaci]|uniref:Uncharacterized protein n=1 Tax=Aphanomyces astaci TaxID=112090 RepID=A0A3R8DQ94_APHAT|nr:hypothetical protein B5M09_013786 [Aphanomyces astaci]
MRHGIHVKYLVALLLCVGCGLIILSFDVAAISIRRNHVVDCITASFESRWTNESILCNDRGKPRLAYMLYATDARTVCNAVIMAHNIRKLGTPPSIPIVTLVVDDVPAAIVQRLTDAGIVAIPVAHWKQAGVPSNAEWVSSLTKLRIFEARGYDKVIYLDSDAVIQRNLDHLFHLGDAVLWAPHAYYIGEQYAFGSTLLVFSPSSNQTFETIERAMATPPRPDYYDMDVLNDLFRTTCGYLPNHYVVLTYTIVDDATWSFTSKAERILSTYVHHFSPGLGIFKPWNTPRSILDHREASYEPLFYDLLAEYWDHEDAMCAWLQAGNHPTGVENATDGIHNALS